MSALVDRFLRYLDSCGLSVQGPRDGDPDDRLYLMGPAAEKTSQVMDALKKFKPELLKRYGRRPTAAEQEKREDVAKRLREFAEAMGPRVEEPTAGE